jgi:transposase InsO family protein
MDIAENLNKSGGYSHLLITQCVFSDFTVIVPLKSKTAEEVNRGLLNSILQQFNVEKLHSDNGKGFRGTDWLESMSGLGIKVIASSSLHPQGRGQIERLVGTVKLLLKKLLTNQKSLNWEYLP